MACFVIRRWYIEWILFLEKNCPRNTISSDQIDISFLRYLSFSVDLVKFSSLALLSCNILDMNHEDPNHGPASSPPVVSPPMSPSHPMVAPQPPSSHPMVMSGMVRPKPSIQPLEIPQIPILQSGSMSPNSVTFSPRPYHQQLPSPGRSHADMVPPSLPSGPHTRARLRPQPLEIPANPAHQPEMISPALRVTSPAAQVAAMSPKLSPTSQRQSMSSTPRRQSISMPPTPHHRPVIMMGPPLPSPHCQPYMYPPPPYYHPGPPFNVAMAPPPPGGFQAPNHCYPEHERAWSTDLFECTKDIKNCTRTLCCPCVTFGQIAEIVNEGTTPWYEPGLLCALISAFSPCFCIFHPSFPYTACYRTRLRNKYKLKGSILEDCLVHSFCECCALCQEFRELDHQGFDVPLGWHENKRRERQAVAVFRFIPPEEQGMTR